jgi:molybdate-binding protein
LAQDGVDPKEVAGYTNEVYTHLEVGLAILKGEADVGLGIQTAAEFLGLRFIPVTTERYDLLVPQGPLRGARSEIPQPPQFEKVLEGSKGTAWV